MSAERPLAVRIDRATALAATVCAILVALFFFTTQRAIPKSELYETAAWGILVMTAFVGWGSAVNTLVARDRAADLGLRATWGASALVFAGGLLAAVSGFSRVVVVIMVDAGVLLAGVYAVRERARLFATCRLATRAARMNGLLTTLAVAIALATLVHYLGGVADPTSNPYDDDTAYFPFVKKLLQTGTLIEPFSFRRLSALGGQTFFLALMVPHATYRQLNSFDRGICIVLVVLLIVGHKDGRRRVPAWLTLITLAFVLSLPNISINTAAHYAGFAFFLGLFRTMTWVDASMRDWQRGVVLALVAAATCTLRQNYLVVPVLMLAFGYAYAAFGREARVAGAPWKTRLREPVIVAALSVAALLPWFVVAYRSNQTFLFPVQQGTFRRALELKSSNMSMWKELKFLFSVTLENEPIKAMSMLALAGALVKERHATKPLRSFWLACAVGLVVLSHSFSQSDAGNLARYLFGFFAALAVAVILTLGTSTPRPVKRLTPALLLVGAALAAQVPSARVQATKTYQTFVRYIDASRRKPGAGPDTLPVEALIYPHVQATIPAGEAVAVMVDDTYYLDFARNRIFNLDMPGYSSLKPDMPYFEGPEKVAEYFLRNGIRYVMYVRPEHSHFLYQREFWFARFFDPEELWRVCAPYFVDLIDNFTSLRDTRKVVHEEAGIVVLDLATPLKAGTP